VGSGTDPLSDLVEVLEVDTESDSAFLLLGKEHRCTRWRL